MNPFGSTVRPGPGRDARQKTHLQNRPGAGDLSIHETLAVNSSETGGATLTPLGSTMEASRQSSQPVQRS